MKMQVIRTDPRQEYDSVAEEILLDGFRSIQVITNDGEKFDITFGEFGDAIMIRNIKGRSLQVNPKSRHMVTINTRG